MAHRTTEASPPPLQKAPTGIPGFDEITHGGLPAGRPTLVCGGPGSGKTLFAISFLVNGAVEFGESGVLMSFGEDATQLAEDVAVVDIGLPGMDGYELARRIRAEPEGRHVTLIALTGYGFPEDRERAHAAGFDRHLVKPAAREDLPRELGLTVRVTHSDGA